MKKASLKTIIQIFMITYDAQYEIVMQTYGPPTDKRCYNCDQTGGSNNQCDVIKERLS